MLNIFGRPVGRGPHDAETQPLFGEIPKADAPEASDAIELPEAAASDVAKLVRAVPMATDDEDDEEEDGDEDDCGEEEEEQQKEEQDEASTVLRTEQEEQQDECVEEEKEQEPLLDGNEEARKATALADTPGKATVHYDADEVLPPCPATTAAEKAKVMSAAEQMELTKGRGRGSGRGRGRSGAKGGGRGKGRGRGQGRGRGRGRGNHHVKRKPQRKRRRRGRSPPLSQSTVMRMRSHLSSVSPKHRSQSQDPREAAVLPGLPRPKTTR